MEPEYKFIHEITPTTRDWTSCLKVIQMSDIRTGKTNPIKYRKYLLADKKGQSVEITVFADNIDLLTPALQPGSSVVLKNATVSKVPDYINNVSTSQYQWTYGKNSSLLPAQEAKAPFAGLDIQTVQSGDFHAYLESGQAIHVACVFIAYRGSRWVPTKNGEAELFEYAAVDKELNPFVVSCWSNAVPPDMLALMNSVTNNPTFLLLNFKVVSYYGLSLNSTPQAYVLHNCAHKKIFELDKWKENVTGAIHSLKKRDLFENKVLGSPKQPLRLTALSVLKDVSTDGNFVVRIKARLDLEHQDFYYMCCPVCGTRTPADYEEEFYCTSNQCTKSNKVQTADKRLKLKLTIYDNTGEIEVTFFDREATKLLGEEKDVFLSRTSQESNAQCSYIREALLDLEMLLKVRFRLYNSNRNFTVDAIQILDGSETFPPTQPLPTPSEPSGNSPNKAELAETETLHRSPIPKDPVTSGSSRDLHSVANNVAEDVAQVIADLEEEAYESDLGTPTSRKLAALRKESINMLSPSSEGKQGVPNIPNKVPQQRARSTPVKTRVPPPPKKHTTGATSFKAAKKTVAAATKASVITELVKAGYTMLEASTACGAVPKEPEKYIANAPSTATGAGNNIVDTNSDSETTLLEMLAAKKPKKPQPIMARSMKKKRDVKYKSIDTTDAGILPAEYTAGDSPNTICLQKTTKRGRKIVPKKNY